MKKIFSIFAAVLFAGSMMADAITCAEAREKALAGNTDEVTVRGYVTSIKTAWNSQFKNISFWMADTKDGGEVFQAYRAACEKEADAPGVGDLVEAKGKLTKYNDTPELEAGCTFTIVEKGEPVVPENHGKKTIAEFLALKDATNPCILTGEIKNIVMDKNDPTKPNKYGNFDLEDATGKIYIYGLLNENGEAQKFVEMELVEGDIISLQGTYTEYNGNPQIKNAQFLCKGEYTAVENVVLGEKAQKVMVDGNVYIVRDNKLFNLQGAQVR